MKDHQESTQSTPLPQQQNPVTPNKLKLKNRKIRVIRIVAWLIIGILVGIIASFIQYNETIQTDSCASKDLGFPFKIGESGYGYRDDVLYYTFPDKYYDPNPNVEEVAVVSSCGIYSSLSKWSIWSIILNVIVFTTFFLLIDFLVKKKSQYWLYLFNPLFVLILYLIAVFFY